MLAFSHWLSVRIAKLALQSHGLLLERSCLFFENTVCTPASPWCFSSSLLHLANHLPAFYCITLVTRPTGARFFKGVHPLFRPSQKKVRFLRIFFVIFHFFPVENLSLAVWIEAYRGSSCMGFWCPQKSLGTCHPSEPTPRWVHYSCGCTQLTCSLSR